jgi:pilus assembly protein CpaB
VDGRCTEALIALPSGAMNPLRPVVDSLRRLHRRVLLHRRPLAALTAAGAALAALQATSPPPPETVAVWTASHDLSGGRVVEQADLVSTSFFPDTVPAGAVESAAALVGHTLAAPMSRGEAFTHLRLVTPGLLHGYPGRTVVPLRITDAAVVPLLRVGDRISLVAADPDGRRSPHLLVEDVPVVAIPRAQGGGLTSGTPGRLVLAAVPTASADEVAATAATSVLIPVWKR